MANLAVFLQDRQYIFRKGYIVWYDISQSHTAHTRRQSHTSERQTSHADHAHEFLPPATLAKSNGSDISAEITHMDPSATGANEIEAV
jgi:hypothetical protein